MDSLTLSGDDLVKLNLDGTSREAVKGTTNGAHYHSLRDHDNGIEDDDHHHHHDEAIQPHHDADEEADGAGGGLSAYAYSLEAAEQMLLGFPITGMYIMDYLTVLVTVAFVGRIGTLELAAAALAMSLGNVSGFSILEGLASAMETFCGQAFGAESYLTLGLMTYRVHILLTACCIPISIIWINLDSILIGIGQDPQIAELAMQFLAWEIPGLFIRAAYLPLTKFFQVQSVTGPLAWISFISLLFHAPSTYLFVFYFNFGLVGAAKAYSLTAFFQLLLGVAFLRLFDTDGKFARCWPRWSIKSVLSGWGTYFAVATPACSMLCLEWWYVEVLVLMSGWLPNTQANVAAMSITMSTVYLTSLLPWSFGMACSVRVSNELGAGNSGRARNAMIVSQSIVISFGVLLAVALFLVRNDWAILFIGGKQDAQSATVSRFVAANIPIICLTQVFMGIAHSLQGVLRGSGLQDIGSAINLITFYLMATPLSGFLAFGPQHLGVLGLWTGFLAGVALQSSGLAIAVYRIDWPGLAERATLFVSSNKVDDNEHSEDYVLLHPEK